MKNFAERNREWFITYHKEAVTTNDIELARDLYEQRIKDLGE